MSIKESPKIIDESKEDEVEFPQGGSIINFGTTPLSTFNLVNCIAIGGCFILKERKGSFMTHESPVDYKTLQEKLKNIMYILNENGADIQLIVLFHSDVPAKQKYSQLGGMTTSDIVETMRLFCETTFPNVKITLKTYSNSPQSDIFKGKILVGKASISPTYFSTYLTPLRSVDAQALGRQSRDSFWSAPISAQSSSNFFGPNYMA